MLTLESFEEASEVVKRVTQETKLVYSKYFSDQTGNRVYLKPENMQITGAYKIRGAYYSISTLSKEEQERGLITASAGNHAQGVAYAAKELGVKAVVVMPVTTPLMKVNRTKSYGAEVILHGEVYDEACEYAYQLAEENGYTFIHPFDDLAVATGQGTIAMEIVKELPLVDYILVPVGGGGLATGVSTLAKMLNPNIRDDELIVAFVDMVENHKMIVENSGLLTVAALKHMNVKNKKIVAILSGGNMDVITMSSVVQFGLIQRDRIFTVSVLLPDTPGELVRVSTVVAEMQGNVIKLDHNQFVSTNRSKAVELKITMEAFGTEHKNQIVHALEEHGFKPRVIRTSL